MSIVLTNLSSTQTLTINDLGDILKYGKVAAQYLLLDPNETISINETDEARASILVGDIKKYVTAGLLSVDAGTGYVTSQVQAAGKAAATAVGLTGIQTVSSILAFVTATGAPAVKTLLALGVDYSVASGDVTCITDQSANTLLITYEG